jgi:hypothetical protein
MLFRFAKLTFAIFILLGITRTLIWTKNILAQNDFLDPNANIYTNASLSSWLANIELNSPNPPTIFPAHSEIVASVSNIFSKTISPNLILFFACVLGAIFAGGYGFSRLVDAIERRDSHWPEEF